MYGQPHGERVNADVSASEASPYLVEYPGKHCSRDNTPTVVGAHRRWISGKALANGEHRSTHRRLCFRHQTHVRNTQQVGVLSASGDKAGPLETLSRAHALAAAAATAGARLVLAAAP